MPRISSQESKFVSESTICDCSIDILRPDSTLSAVLETKNHPNMKYVASLILALVVPSIALADDAEKAKLMELGKAGYIACAACHGMDGQGVAAGAKKMAPSLTGSKIATGNPAIFALVIQNGIAKENQDWLGMMAALGATMDDEKLAAVMTYVRNSFGNTGSVVTAADAKKYREEFKAIAGPVTRAKLAELDKK
jgi:mono/diheme cytochrome c family protein